MVKKITINAEWKGIADKLTDEQAGQLFKNIFNYVNKEEITFTDKATEIAFEPIRLSLDEKLHPKKKEPTVISWRTDFEKYKRQLRAAYKELINDKEFIEKQQKFHPNVNIKLSIEKACVNFWATKEGWNHKKKSRTNDIDWKATLTNAISLNKVYFKKEEIKPKATWGKKLT